MISQTQPFVLPPVNDLVGDGIHFRSARDGRFLLYRGMCFGPVAKFPPFLPLKNVEDWEMAEPFLDLLLACGFTTLRLPFSWAAFEPELAIDKPSYDEQYFEAFFSQISLFEKKGFAIFLDIHQDLVQPAFGGNGFPEWVLEDGSKPRMYFNNTPWWGLNYVLNKGLRKTFTQFWKNDLTNTSCNPPLNHFPVRDRYLDMVDRIAERTVHHPGIFGFEVINEPHPATLDPVWFEEELLNEFYSQAIERIRKHNNHLFVFLAPQSDWNVNVRRDRNYISRLKMQQPQDDRLVFAFHYYDSLLTGLHGFYFHEMKRDEYVDAIKRGIVQAQEKGMVPFLTEFGSRQNWLGSVTKRHMSWQFEAAERAMAHATYWNINLYNTKKERDGFMKEDFSLIDHEMLPRNLAIATRPYVMAASAEPVTMVYNDRSLRCDIHLKGKPLDEWTVVYVPCVKKHQLMPHIYTRGFEVRYNENGNGAQALFLPEHNQLMIKLDQNSIDHHITIDQVFTDSSSAVLRYDC